MEVVAGQELHAIGVGCGLVLCERRETGTEQDQDDEAESIHAEESLVPPVSLARRASSSSSRRLNSGRCLKITDERRHRW